MRKSAVIFVLFLLVLSTLQAVNPRSRRLMDQGQCRPEFDQETAFWGYDCTYVPEGAPKNEASHIKISPQFSFATPFINGRAKVLLGCRLVSLACVSYRGMVGHINTDGNIVFFEREDGKLSVRLNSQVKQFLAESNLAFSTIEDMVIVERSEKLLDFLLDHFEPPVTPVKASYSASK